jgi:hypothetical protein
MNRLWRVLTFVAFLTFALLNGGAGPCLASNLDTVSKPNASLATVAGEYYQGDGLGANLTLVVKPAGSFSFQAAGCLRTYTDVTAKALLRNGMLVLASDRAGSESRFLPVRWGDRLYLIEPERLVAFANAVNAGHEPRMKAQGVFFLRSSDWNKPVTGGLRLPVMYRDYLLPRPVEVRVLRVLDAEENLELSAGRRQGLLPGMKLRSRGVDDGRDSCKLTVVEAGEETAVAKQNWVCDDLKPGDQATTRWRDVEPPYGRWEDDF